MSLISTASTWTNDNQTRKRVPTMKRMTAKLRAYDNPNSSAVDILRRNSKGLFVLAHQESLVHSLKDIIPDLKGLFVLSIELTIKL